MAFLSLRSCSAVVLPAASVKVTLAIFLFRFAVDGLSAAAVPATSRQAAPAARTARRVTQIRMRLPLWDGWQKQKRESPIVFGSYSCEDGWVSGLQGKMAGGDHPQISQITQIKYELFNL